MDTRQAYAYHDQPRRKKHHDPIRRKYRVAAIRQEQISTLLDRRQKRQTELKTMPRRNLRQGIVLFIRS